MFAGYDHRYSLYDPSSVLSRIARGDLRLTDAPQDVRDVYALALEWRDRTGGAFTPHRPDGVVDLSGVVKALAIRDAGALLDDGSQDWLLNAGGDVLARGRHRGVAPWSVGVVDPARREVVRRRRGLKEPRRAVATSGTAERGEHVWRRAGLTFVQATVVADDIVTADVLATAIVAGDADDLGRSRRTGRSTSSRSTSTAWSGLHRGQSAWCSHPPQSPSMVTSLERGHLRPASAARPEVL